MNTLINVFAFQLCFILTAAFPFLQSLQYPSVQRTSVMIWWRSLLFCLVSTRTPPGSLSVVIKSSGQTSLLFVSDTPHGLLPIREYPVPPEMLIKHGGVWESRLGFCLVPPCKTSLPPYAWKPFDVKCVSVASRPVYLPLRFWFILLSCVKCTQ